MKVDPLSNADPRVGRSFPHIRGNEFSYLLARNIWYRDATAIFLAPLPAPQKAFAVFLLTKTPPSGAGRQNTHQVVANNASSATRTVRAGPASNSTYCSRTRRKPKGVRRSSLKALASFLLPRAGEGATTSRSHSATPTISLPISITHPSFPLVYSHSFS